MYGTSTGVAFVGQSSQGPVQAKPPSEIETEMQRLNGTISHLHDRIEVLTSNLVSVLDTSERGVSSAVRKIDEIISRLRI